MCAPVAIATAEDAPKTTSNAAQVCKAERTAAGSAEAFRMLIAERNKGTKVTASNAFGKCVSGARKKDAAQTKTAKSSANAECKAMSQEQLAAQYGKKRNAFGKCVSDKASSKKAAADAAEVTQARKVGNAAKQCKAKGLKGRKFGACVSSTAKAQND